ncbi:calcium-binding protein [Paraburkholderia hayleyella]|uniref:calcium-binding protein n=1 Tax=Paraburkholderia hayleyella TaxID=2152889 RepID=UPI001290DB31|nr:calcium-binding protein [Paraburkholderia hayleyella]
MATRVQSTAVKALLKSTANTMLESAARLSRGGEAGYARYGRSVISLAQAAAAGTTLGRASKLVDIMTLSFAMDRGRSTRDWSEVAGVIGGIAGSIQGAELGATIGVTIGASLAIYAGIPFGGAFLILAVGLGGAAGAYLGGKYGTDLGQALWKAFAVTPLYQDITDFLKPLAPGLGMIDPLILDLDGDGVHTTGVDHSEAHFDFAGEGSRTHTGWISTGDGLLVLDRNHNGLIDTGAELFSNFTQLANGTLAANGFEALREFDFNKDGIIDHNDSVWSSLRIWRDGNRDGATQDGELLTLTQLGIVEIRLSRDSTVRTLENGNIVRGTGSFVHVVNGIKTEHEMLEVWFGQDKAHQKFDTPIPLREDVQALPNIQGVGNVRDLRQAASMDTKEGAALRTLLAQLAAATTPTQLLALIEPLLNAWVATSGMETTQARVTQGRRTLSGCDIGAQWLGRLAVLEKLSGTMLEANQNEVLILTSTRFGYITRAWETLTHSVYNAAASQTTWKPCLDAIRYTLDTSGKISADFSAMVTLLKNAESRIGAVEVTRLMTELTRQYGAGWHTAGFDMTSVLRDYVMTHESGALREALTAMDVFYGSGRLEGGRGADILLARDEASELLGGAGDDVLRGGRGNDTLRGGDGSDTYWFGRHSGNDTVSEEYDVYGDYTDVVRFDADVRPEDVSVRRDGRSDDLLITIRDSDSVLRIRDQLRQHEQKFFAAIEQFKFANGTTWSKEDVALMTLKGTPGDDIIQGFNGDDLMDGGAGNDTLYGGDGNDTYCFGKYSGNDTIAESSDFQDKYTDVVRFDADIKPEDVTVKRDGRSDDLLITIMGSENVLRIRDQLRQHEQKFFAAIEQFKFANGTTWSKEDVALMTLKGTPGDDIIQGFNGDDLMDGGAGNDTLYGGDGNDTYLFGRRSGNDTIAESSDFQDKYTDVVRFDADIKPEDITVKRDGRSDDLLITIRGSENVLRIRDQLRQHEQKFFAAIEQFKFANGTTWSKEDVALMTLKGTPGDDIIQGFNGDDLMDGGAGNDTLYGGDGNDIYLFGKHSGNDTIAESSDFQGQYTDVVRFDADIKPEDVTVKRDGRSDDLLITIRGSDSVLRIRDQLRQHEQKFFAAIEQFKFANGTTWSKEEVALMTLKGTPGDDIIQGFNGDDLMDGGAGNDTLYGGDGNDTYRFGKHSGNDTIAESSDFQGQYTDVVRFDADIKPEDIAVRRDGRSDDLLITIRGSDSVLRIRDQLRQHEQKFFAAIEQFKFANGTTWSKEDVALMTLKGTPGDDLIQGFNGDDLMDGGAGNDTLYGGDGNDTYLFGRRSGNDTIAESSDFQDKYTDVVRFDADIKPEDITVRRDGRSDDLLITIRGSDSVLRIRDQFRQHEQKFFAAIEQFKFANGTTWSKEDVALMTLKGTPGDDLIQGFNGDDLMDGGTGNDTLYGGDGSDTYRFGKHSGHNRIIEGYDFSKRYIDVVKFDDDIRPEDVILSREEYNSENVLITLKGAHNELKLVDQLAKSGSEYVKGVEALRFADGTVWDKETIAQRASRAPRAQSLMSMPGENRHLSDPVGYWLDKAYAAGLKRAGEEEFGALPSQNWKPLQAEARTPLQQSALQPLQSLSAATLEIDRQAEMMYQGLLAAYGKSPAITTWEPRRESASFAPPLIATDC